jgi:hypothetical protein
VVKAINNHPNLKIGFDNSQEGLKKNAKGWLAKSHHRLFRHVAGAVDGLSVKTKTPSKKKVMNQARFVSGNKRMTCLNMQAICNYDYQFSAVTCMHVGCTNDINAFETSSLKDLCKNLPFPYHLLGDPAYTSTESMLVAFSGQNLHLSYPYKEVFNFYHSQLRIYIECTFGIFVRRWGILWSAMGYDLDFQCEIIHALCRLHNFCIQQKQPILNRHSLNKEPVLIDGRLADPSWRSEVEPVELELENTSGINTLRNSILENITARNILRVRSHNR